jgi:hypothetical protein
LAVSYFAVGQPLRTSADAGLPTAIPATASTVLAATPNLIVFALLFI